MEGAGANIDVIILPKVKGPRDVWFFDTLLTQLEVVRECHHPSGGAGRPLGREQDDSECRGEGRTEHRRRAVAHDRVHEDPDPGHAHGR